MRRNIVIITLCRALALAGFAAFLSLEAGCAYYNYLYDARKDYADGERQRLEGQTAQGATGAKKGLTSYDKCVEAAGRLLQYYPGSRWEDDALLLLAKAYYRTGKYRNAVVKIDELGTKYPKSPLISEGLLWKGMSLLKVAQRDSARVILDGLLSESSPRKWRLEAQFALAEDSYDAKEWNDALDQYKNVVADKSADKWTRNQAWLKIGDCLEQDSLLQEAVANYKALLAEKPPRPVALEATLSECEALSRLGQYSEALTLLEGLLDDAAYADDFPRINLAVAVTYSDMGKAAEAKERLQEILKGDARGDVAVRANYELGRIIWMQDRDFGAARPPLLDATKLNRSSEYGTRADSLLKEIEQLYGFWQKITYYRGQSVMIDSAVAGMRTMLPRDTLYVDSLALMKGEDQKRAGGRPAGRERIKKPPKAKKEAAPVMADSTAPAIPDSLRSLDSTMVAALRIGRRNALLATQLDLAAFHLFRRSATDSAKFYYGTVTSSDSSAEYWGRAAASLAYIASQAGDTLTRDSLYRVIADRLPDAPIGLGAREELGLPIIQAAPDTVTVLLAAAEGAWLGLSDYKKGRELYLEAAGKADSASADRARALLGAAYLSRQYLGDDSAAVLLYGQIADQIKRKDYAQVARKWSQALKTGELGPLPAEEKVRRPRPQEEQLASAGETGGEASDTTGGQGLIMTADQVDEPPQMVTPQLALENYVRSYYPGQAFGAGVEGKATVEFVVSETGSITDPKVISEDPENSGFGAAALQVAGRLHYNAGRFRGMPVPVRVQREFDFRISGGE